MMKTEKIMLKIQAVVLQIYVIVNLDVPKAFLTYYVNVFLMNASET